jgi:hypothetical protein
MTVTWRSRRGSGSLVVSFINTIEGPVATRCREEKIKCVLSSPGRVVLGRSVGRAQAGYPGQRARDSAAAEQVARLLDQTLAVMRR